MSSTNTAMRHGSRGAVRHVARIGIAPAHPLDHRPIDEVWHEYSRTKDVEVRSYLVQKYLQLVRFNAERIYARLPDEVDIEDLMSVGQFGLMEAIENFEPDRGVKFETFCAPRIRGAILDELRNMDWVPRLVRQRTARVEHARQSIEMETGRRATDDEISGRLAIPNEEFQKYMRDSDPVGVTSINRKFFGSDGSRELRELDVIKDETQADPVVELQRRDLKTLITKGLTRAERLIIILYYYEGMTMKDIGQTLALSESRVSQMHSSILARLRAQMQHRMKEFEPVDDR